MVDRAIDDKSGCVEHFFGRWRRVRAASAQATCVVVMCAALALDGAVALAQGSPTALKVAAAAGPFRTPLDIAMERGLLAEEGISVELVQIQSAPDQMPLLATGRVDIALTGPAATHFNALAADVPVKFVASCGGSSRDGKVPALMLTVRKDLIDSGRVRSIKDLRGLRIGIPNKESKAYVDAWAWLQKGELKLSDVTFVSPMRFPEMLVGITNKAIDAAITLEPFVTLGASENVSALLVGDNEIMPSRDGCAVTFGQRMVTDRELGRRFLRAWIKGARIYNDAIFKSKGRAEVVQLMASKHAVKDISMYDRMMPFPIDPNGRLNRASVELDLKVYGEMGLLTGKVSVDRLIDESLAREVVSELGVYE